ncbi:MAG: c-type cytochrome [Sedimentisphaerales bacterium]|nr:c-type cytochrome [Sedimentisphaerales bacterium]
MKDHPPEKFGCTICHRGQGRAIVSDEAKAVGHHWDYPILPVNLTQSSCGLCHTAKEVADRGGDKYASGKMLFEAKGCRACHKLNGRGGSLGPALDNEGLRVRGQLPMVHVTGVHTLPQWLAEHFDNPQKIVAGSKMVPPQLSREENESLSIYILSLQNRDLPKSYITAEKHQEYFKAVRPDPASGEELYATFCAACHDTGKFGRYDKFFGKFIPAVRGTSFVQTASSSYVDAMIRFGRPGTIMPAWGSAAGGLNEAEIVKLRTYFLSSPVDSEDTLSGEILATANNPKFAASGDVSHGGEIFAKHCAACHAPMGGGRLGPSIINSTFQKNAADGFLYATIAMGRRNTAMPAFLAPGRGGFTESDIADVIVFIRSLAEKDKSQPQAGAKSELPIKPKEKVHE